jgi:hypothetical protein
MPEVPSYTKDDLLVCIRDKVPEVWTMRAFRPQELQLLPYTNEVKDACV